jgi:hypothetical protein
MTQFPYKHTPSIHSIKGLSNHQLTGKMLRATLCCYPQTYLKSENTLNPSSGTTSISWKSVQTTYHHLHIPQWPCHSNLTVGILELFFAGTKITLSGTVDMYCYGDDCLLTTYKCAGTSHNNHYLSVLSYFQTGGPPFNCKFCSTEPTSPDWYICILVGECLWGCVL